MRCTLEGRCPRPDCDRMRVNTERGTELNLLPTEKLRMMYVSYLRIRRS